MPSRGSKSLWLLLTILLLLVAATACSSPAAEPSEPGAQESEGETTSSEAADKDFTVKLAENAWSGSRVNVAVAKQLLEEKLGYDVEVVTIDENLQWGAISSGEIHASLEVWPSGHAENIQDYIEEQQVVENVGLLGPVGKIGWFVPTYVVEAHPELKSWEGFQDPELAKLFATAETGEKGQFLAGDPSWVQYDEDIIKNLGLPLQVVHAGSEEALLAALDGAYSRQEPILFYFYTPHSIFSRYDLIPVELPPYSEECYARAEEGGVDCDYPPDELFKIVWPELKEQAPEAYEFLRNFHYTSDDQIGLIAAVELEGKSPEEAASEWIAENEAVWQEWLP